MLRCIAAGVLIVGIMVASEPARGEPSPPNGIDDSAKIARLETRVAELEAQNREILALLRSLHEKQGDSETVAATTSVEALDRTTEVTIPNQVKAGRDSAVGFYGFIRLDAIFDDSRPSAIQTPTFIRSEAPGAEDQDSFNFHPRLTRFGFNYDGPRIGGDGGDHGGAKLGAKIEIDFQAGGGEARQLMRMRHAYMTVDWAKTRLLVGQTWDLMSPLYPTVNSDTLMWNAGNLGDRRPQIRGRFMNETAGGGILSFEGGLGLSGAIDRQDLDANGVRDGDDGLLQNLQARLAYGRSATGRRWNVGLSGHFGREETEGLIAGHDSFDSSSLSFDFEGKWGKVGLKGEIWTGSNLDDFRGGAGQGVNVATGREIDASGGWLELGLDLTKVYSLYFGYTVDDPSDEDLPDGGRTRNGAWYLVNRFKIARPFMIGIDYLNWQTEFKGLPEGDDNRFNLYLVYNF
jgi:hypothetical protein